MIDFDGLVLGPCMRIFGEDPSCPVSYQPGDGPPFTITGVFDKAYRPVDPLAIDGLIPSHVTNDRPALGVQLSAFPAEPEQNDLVTIRGELFRVLEVHPDGVGGARLMLNRAT